MLWSSVQIDPGNLENRNHRAVQCILSLRLVREAEYRYLFGLLHKHRNNLCVLHLNGVTTLKRQVAAQLSTPPAAAGVGADLFLRRPQCNMSPLACSLTRKSPHLCTKRIRCRDHLIQLDNALFQTKQ